MKKKISSIKNFSKTNVLIAANDPMIVELLTNAIAIMDLFGGVIKHTTPDISTILSKLEKVSLIISAFDQNQDNLQFTRAIRSQEFSSLSEFPAAMVWSTLAINAEERSMARKMGVDHFIARPFLTEKVVEVLLKVIKIS